MDTMTAAPRAPETEATRAQGRRELRDRLWNPPNGQRSSEIEILSGPGLRRRRIDIAVDAYAARQAFRRLLEQIARPIVAVFQELEPQPVTPPTLTTILRAVCRHYEISAMEIRSDRRMAYIVRPRHVTMYLGRHFTTKSLPAIGRVLGRRDHTTVLSAVRGIERRILVDFRLAADIDNIKWEMGIR